MKIIWDEPKRLANLDKHGMDFAMLTVDFFAESIVVPAKLGRYKAIGRIGEKTAVVIFQTLGNEALSVISLRSANPKEGKLYND